MQTTYYRSVMKRTIGLFLMLISGTIMAQTIKTVATINGEKITVVPSGAQTNTLSLTGNTLTSTVNGVPASSSAVSTVANTLTGNSLKTSVNGVESTAINLSSGFWSRTGNSGTSSATDYIGTSDNVNFFIKRNNVQKVVFGSSDTQITAPLNVRGAFQGSDTKALLFYLSNANNDALNFNLVKTASSPTSVTYFEMSPGNIGSTSFCDFSLLPSTSASVFIGGYKVLANSTERLEVNGKVKATGFKIPNGLSTQYLMADGSVSTGGTGGISGIQSDTDKNVKMGSCLNTGRNNTGLVVLKGDKTTANLMMSLSSCDAENNAQELLFTRVGNAANPKFEIQALNQSFTDGTTTPLSLQPKGGSVTVGVDTGNSGTSGYLFWVNGTAGGVNGWNTTSDKRLKNNIQPVQNGLSTVLKMNPVSYDKKATLSSTDYTIEEIGFIAQELQPLFSKGVVNEANDKEKLLSVNYTALIPVLTKAIQEQQKIIEEEKAKNDKQQKEIDELKAIVKELMGKK
jgi:hypothetical protein